MQIRVRLNCAAMLESPPDHYQLDRDATLDAYRRSLEVYLAGVLGRDVAVEDDPTLCRLQVEPVHLRAAVQDEIAIHRALGQFWRRRPS